MAPMHLNYIAILIAFVVVFIGGALWYSPVLFAKRWAELTHVDMAGRSPVSALVGQGVLTLISIVALAVVVGWAAPSTIVEGGCCGFLVSAGFMAADAGKLVLFEKRPMGLFWINQGYNVIAMTVAGMILAAMPAAM